MEAKYVHLELVISSPSEYRTGITRICCCSSESVYAQINCLQMQCLAKFQ